MHMNAFSPVTKYFKPKEVDTERGIFGLFSRVSVALCLIAAIICGLSVIVNSFIHIPSNLMNLFSIAVLWKAHNMLAWQRPATGYHRPILLASRHK